MDRENILGIFLSFLVIAAMLLSYSVEGVSLSNSVSSSQQSSFCNNANQTALTKDQPSDIKQNNQELPSTQGTGTISSSCTTSLQVIPVAKQKLGSPAENSMVFPPYTSTISSQAFVFQEPDPPQTI